MTPERDEVAALTFGEFSSGGDEGDDDVDADVDALLLLSDDALLDVDPLALDADALDLRLSSDESGECSALLWAPLTPPQPLAAQEAVPAPANPQRRARRRPQKAPDAGAKPRKPLNYNPNKARDERREELLYLRKKVLELETQLDGLRQKRPRLLAGSGSAGAAGATTTSDQQQLALVGILEKLLAKKAGASSRDAAAHCPQCQELHHVYPPTRDPRTDAQVFEDLAAGVAQAYSEVDAVFAANGLAQLDGPLSDARIRADGGHHDDMFLEVLASKVLPFGVHATASAAWHYLVHAKQRTPFRSYFFDSPTSADTTDDTIAENFSLGLHANSTSAHFRVKQLQRRFIERERVVIVWRSFVEPVEFSDEPLSDLRFRERG
ncbi:hypothetical protein PybrP1_012613 [[Pythium] brassicae (nom. inval.)]|nr:hypothetical protein PybrP1_012613 [[Pythium] brassicae (nom. inval.)]